jgi:hypothetical protein
MGDARGGRVLAVLALLGVLGCGDDNSSSPDNGAGQPTPPLWNDNSTTASGGTGDTPLLWNDPNTANTQFGVQDPSDVRTYTYPDIYILGNKHPLMTEVNSRDFPIIITQENRLTEILIEWRILEYERLLQMRRTDIGFPRAAFLAEYLDLRRNARAHAKHYAVWHTDVSPLPLCNNEGDLAWYTCGPTGAEVRPDMGRWGGGPNGRLPKSKVEVDVAGQLVASGPRLGIPDTVATQWITNFPAFLRWQEWTHLGVGYWNGTGSSDLHYWNAVYAKNPRPRADQAPIPVIFF